jgi:hypothetical protein
LPQLPRIMIWVWERPEKLDLINPRELGVDFLARTVTVRGGIVMFPLGLQPLVVARGP